MRLEAFPWARFELLSSGDGEAVAGIGPWLSAPRLRTYEALASSAFGLKVDLRLRSLRAEPARTEVGPQHVGVLFAAIDRDMQYAWMLSVEPGLAVALVARLVNQRGVELLDPSRIPSPRLSGALGAFVHAMAGRILAQASVSSPSRILAAGSARVLEADLNQVDRVGFVAEFTVVFAEQAYAATLRGPTVLEVDSQSTLTSDALMALGDLPLRLSLVATIDTLDAQAVARLAPGDVWFPARLPVDAATMQFAGPLWLCAPHGEHAARIELGQDREWRFCGKEPLSWVPSLGSTQEFALSGAEANEGGDVMEEVLESVPVVARLEIGSVEMSAAKWAGLRIGDVISSGRRVGGLITMRVAGVEVARGELVQIDGEMGVRIVEKCGPPSERTTIEASPRP